MQPTSNKGAGLGDPRVCASHTPGSVNDPCCLVVGQGVEQRWRMEPTLRSGLRAMCLRLICFERRKRLFDVARSLRVHSVPWGHVDSTAALLAAGTRESSGCSVILGLPCLSRASSPPIPACRSHHQGHCGGEWACGQVQHDNPVLQERVYRHLQEDHWWVVPSLCPTCAPFAWVGARTCEA